MKDHLLMDKLTLHVKVDDENQIYSNYGYNEDNLSPELSTYLLEKAEHAFPLPRKENFIIKIHSQNPNLRLPEITRCVHRHFHNAYDAAKRELRYNTRFTLMLFFIGLLALVLRFGALSWFHFDQTIPWAFFITEVLNIASWVFVWGAVEVFFLERHEILHNCVVLRRLAFAEVVISNDTKMDAPVYI